MQVLLAAYRTWFPPMTPSHSKPTAEFTKPTTECSKVGLMNAMKYLAWRIDLCFTQILFHRPPGAREQEIIFSIAPG